MVFQSTHSLLSFVLVCSLPPLTPQHVSFPCFLWFPLSCPCLFSTLLVSSTCFLSFFPPLVPLLVSFPFLLSLSPLSCPCLFSLLFLSVLLSLTPLLVPVLFPFFSPCLCSMKVTFVFLIHRHQNKMAALKSGFMVATIFIRVSGLEVGGVTDSGFSGFIQ